MIEKISPVFDQMSIFLHCWTGQAKDKDDGCNLKASFQHPATCINQAGCTIASS